ncbi:hypothetical protein D3C76_1405390 [compost metagenome]
MAIGFGRRHQRPQYRLAMLLDLGRRQAIEGLRFGRLPCALAGLPVAIGLVGQHAERGEAAVGDHFAPVLARLLAAQQQAQGASP